MQNSLYGNFRTRKFTDIYDNFNDFKDDIDSTVFASALTEDDLEMTFYLLYAAYGNSHIASSDENQFKFKVFSTIWQYGPTWAKKVYFQSKIRSLTDTELLEGSKSIYNHSFNPSTLPSTGSLEELTTINDQNTTNYKRNKLDAFFQASTYLEQDFTKEYIDRFKNLFVRIVEPQVPLWYESEDEE